MGQPSQLRLTSGVAEGVTGVCLSLVREPDAGNLHVRFDEGDVETELWRSYSGTAKRKGRKQTNWTYGYRATSLLYPLKRDWRQLVRIVGWLEVHGALGSA